MENNQDIHQNKKNEEIKAYLYCELLADRYEIDLYDITIWKNLALIYPFLIMTVYLRNTSFLTLIFQILRNILKEKLSMILHHF